ncbi:MAG: IgGFc-binding protein [Labilithrix sp.]|nr:IgGFc-binding protein [Labilithrix sp.]
MRRAYSLGGLGLAVAVGAALSTLGACGADRDRFDEPPPGFDVAQDAGADAEVCYAQCSLDGRSVVDSCTGAVQEACADDKACGGAKCLEPCEAAGEDRSSDGCEFYFAAPRFQPWPLQSCHAVFVVNSSNQPAELSLDFGDRTLDLSRSTYRAVPNSTDLELLDGPIAPGESAIVFVSDRDQTKSRTLQERVDYIGCPRAVTAAIEEDFGTFGSAVGKAFRLTSNVPVGLTSMFPYGGAASYTPSSTLVFPVSAWANEHLIVNGWESNYGQPTTQIYASEDDTEITILGKKAIRNGNGFTGAAAGMPTKFTLAKGQFAQILQVEDLTGSAVFSNKPTITLGGNSCANIPRGQGACDTLAQVIPPYEQWGSEYVGVSYRPRPKGGDELVWYRIVGGRDGMELDYDPVKPAGAPLTLDAGELVLFRARASEPFVVRSRDAGHPFYLGVHMSGGSGPGLGAMGDPDFVNVVPAGQYRSAYSFYADSSYRENSLVVVRKSVRGEFKPVWLECAGELPDFIPLGTRGDYEYRRVDLSRGFKAGEKFGDKQCITGLQRMRSEGPFAATIWGWDIAASYGYPGGTAIRKLVDVPLAGVN